MSQETGSNIPDPKKHSADHTPVVLSSSIDATTGTNAAMNASLHHLQDLYEFIDNRVDNSGIGRILDVNQWYEEVRSVHPSKEEKKTIVDQTITILEQLYAHLRLKRARHAIDPVQSLRLLRSRINEDMEDRVFHYEMLSILKQLSDIHTAYRLPAPFRNSVAFLPILMKQFMEKDDSGRLLRRYILSDPLWKGGEGPHETFQRGVEIVTWNGIPMFRAVEIAGEKEEGANRDARLALGLQYMTIRWLGASYPPDSPYVDVGYIDKDGQTREVRLYWKILVLNQDQKFVTRVQALWLMTDPQSGTNDRHAHDTAINSRLHIENIARWGLFSPENVQETTEREEDKELAAELIKLSNEGAKSRDFVRFTTKHDTLHPVQGDQFPSLLPLFLRARQLTRKSKRYGYLRIRAFPPTGPARELFVPEFRRLLAHMPEDGLILDIRGNPGGSANNAEELLQLFSPRRIHPINFQFFASPMTQYVTSLDSPSQIPYAQWQESVDIAVQTGADFSAGFPITSPKEANRLGQEYFGPVVLLTDAKSYSASDIFAAGFQDHELGEVVGLDETTGAGGSNVWFYSAMVKAAVIRGDILPSGVEIQFSARRCIRIKKSAGIVLEELGAKTPKDCRHYTTRKDLVDNDVDLIQAAVRRVGVNPPRNLIVDANGGEGEISVSGKCRNINRLDFYIDGQPMESMEIENDEFSTKIGSVGAGQVQLQIRGFAREAGQRNTSDTPDEAVALYKQEISVSE